MAKFEPNPEDVAEFNWQDLLRQPGNHARLLAHLQAKEQRARDWYDPRRELFPGVTGRRSDADFYLGEALPALAGAASPAAAPVSLSRLVSGLSALRNLYNRNNESVYGPASTYGYYGPGQRGFDAATQHGEAFGSGHGPSPNIWKLLESFR